MNASKWLGCVLVALCAACTGAVTEGKVSSSVPEGWGEDFAAAQKAAAKADKFILVAFSGSDWCPWCVRMEKDVYAVKSFVSGAKKDFELVMVDSPQNESILSPLAKAQNPKLLSRYGIQGFPCSVLVHPNGDEAARFSGYQRGGPAAFLEELKKAAAKAGKPRKPAADKEPAAKKGAE